MRSRSLCLIYEGLIVTSALCLCWRENVGCGEPGGPVQGVTPTDSPIANQARAYDRAGTWQDVVSMNRRLAGTVA